MQNASSVLEPISATLAGTYPASPVAAASRLQAPGRLLLMVALPYWLAASCVQLVGWELFVAGGQGATNPAALGLHLEVRALHYAVMGAVVLLAYRVALAIGWPEQGRLLAVLQHAGLALLVAFASRPLFALSIQLVRGVDVFWTGVFLPTRPGAKLWASMALLFLMHYLFGLALIAGARVLGELRRSELERANLRDAWSQSRLQAMRMQLNPHFLFNAFNTIATMLDAPQSAPARKLVVALSDLHRRTLAALDREWMPLSEELEWVEDYLRIQAARFDGRMTYEISCSPALRDVQLPALLLQPLVENAIVHGASDSRDRLHVGIHVRRDTFPGGTPALRIDVVNECSGALGITPGAGLGLRMTRTRLEACYGPRATLEADATGAGSHFATVTLPLDAGS
jgi:hypothetical protein